MNNEEKALEIAVGTVGERTRNHPSNLPHIICVRDACLEMAQWKDEQFKEQKKLTWKEVKYIIELDGDIESDNLMGSDEYYQDIADKANVVLFGLQGKLDD